MRFVTPVRVLLLTATLLLPTASLAGLSIPINPERLDFEDFTFVDTEQGGNNTLTFDVDGREIGVSGQVQANAGGDVVTISYRTDFPNATSASRQAASVTQDEQVRITLDVDSLAGPDYLGQAAPSKCKLTAKLRDNEAGDPDIPDNAQASLSCDLRSNWQELDDDEVPGGGDPPGAVLTIVEQAFAARKDVQVDTNHGRLVIKHKGEAP